MPEKSRQDKKNSLFSNILGLMVILALVGILIVYVIEYFEKNGAVADNTEKSTISFAVAASEMHAPQNWLRTQISPDQSAFSSIDLEIPIQLNGSEQMINVTLLPSSKAVPSAYLLDALYIHKFDESASEQSYGLVIKKLKNEAGFEDEEIWYDALSAQPFVAKCLREDHADQESKNCITIVLVNKRVSALIKFEQGLLPYWRNFSASIGQQLKLLNMPS